MSIQDQVRARPPAQVDSRMLAGGVDFLDYLALQQRCVRDGEDWVSVCEELGDAHRRHAEQERDNGNEVTARYFFFAAQAVYRVGQYGIAELTDERLRIYHKLDD